MPVRGVLIKSDAAALQVSLGAWLLLEITKKYIKYPDILACIPAPFEGDGTGWWYCFEHFH